MKLIATIALASLSFTNVSADGCTFDPWQGTISNGETETFCCNNLDGSLTQNIQATVKSVNNDYYHVQSGSSNDPTYCDVSPPTTFSEQDYHDNLEHTFSDSATSQNYSTESVVVLISCHNYVDDCQISLESMTISNSSSTRSTIGIHRSRDVVSDDCLSGSTCSSTGFFNCDDSITINDEKYCCCPTGGNLCTSASACQGGSTPKNQSDLGMRRFGGSKSKFNRTLKF